ncbi:MFS transporter [Kitasatospora sp. NPDC056531]|uniref:MFS transporter n=1 Tax=Kitasatospora sp. NPDC056531 TaxID=3345856 RepID=UPI00368DB97C
MRPGWSPPAGSATSLLARHRAGGVHRPPPGVAVGLALFTLASAACGLAPTTGALVGSRVVRGLGAALMGPQVLAILRTAFSGAAQARAFARYGLTMGVGAEFGQLIGGLLIRADLLGLGWRSCFLINLPIGRGLDALGAGLVFTAIGLGYLITSNTTHLVTARLGEPRTITVGGLLMAAGLGLLALAAYGAAAGSVWWLAPGLFVDGLGMGLVIAPVTTVALAAVEPQLAGSAAGAVSTVQQVGGAVGIALIGLVYYGAGDATAAFGRSVTALAVLELVLVGLVRLLPRTAGRS